MGARVTAIGLARALGWFSIGLGAGELLAGDRLGATLGVRGGVVRAFGAREIAVGVAILGAGRSRRGWLQGCLWGRVAGDGADLATLAAALGADNPQRPQAALATVVVLGTTVLDVACAIALARG